MRSFKKLKQFVRKCFLKIIGYPSYDEISTDIIEKKLSSQFNDIYKAIDVHDNKFELVFKEILLNNKKQVSYEFCRINKQVFLENKAIYDNVKENNKVNPKISIVIPAYNATNYIKFAIESALSQSYRNFEIIIVNDGSNDNGQTKKIAKSYQKKFPNLISYYEKENGGVSSAINYGIRMMNGEYFVWLSHDDLYKSNFLEEQVKFLSKNFGKKSIGFMLYDIINSNNNVLINETNFINKKTINYLLSFYKTEYSILYGDINGGSVMIPKNVFDECGFFDENDRISQEKDMWYRMMKKGYNFINIPVFGSSIRVHDSQVSKTNSNVRKMTDNKLMSIINDISDERKIELEGSVEAFYQELIYYYDYNNLTVMKKYCEKKKKEFKEK